MPASLSPLVEIGNTVPLTYALFSLAYAEMRLTLARIIFDFDMRLDDSSKRWIERQRAYPLWDRKPLNVYLTPVDKSHPFTS